MIPCLIAVGCNQGNCRATLELAIRQLKHLPETRLLASSDLRETNPVGDVQGRFLNGAVLIETALGPAELMDRLLQLETAAGRNRQQDPGNRPLDLDILLYGQQVLDLPNVTVPHPRMSFRRFVLQSANEIAADMIHPQLQLTLAALWQRIQHERNIVAVWLPDNFDVEQLELRPRDDVHWIVSPSSGELLASLRQHVTVNQHWLVVLFKHPQTFDRLNSAIKLLVLVDRSEVPNSVPPGPRWCLNSSSANELQRSLLTAIEAMR